jgi:hypothetical protein
MRYETDVITDLVTVSNDRETICQVETYYTKEASCFDGEMTTFYVYIPCTKQASSGMFRPFVSLLVKSNSPAEAPRHCRDSDLLPPP